MRILAVFHDNNLNSGATKSFLSNILYINSQDNMQVIAIVPKKEGSLANLLRDNKIETYQMRYGGNVYDAKKRGIYKALAYARCLVKSMISFANCEKSARMLCSLGIDAVYSNTSTIYFGALLARKMKVKHYWHFREFGLDDQGSCHIFPRLYLSLMKQSKYIFTISNILDTYYRNKYRLSNTVVLYNDISKEYINNQKKKHSTINGSHPLPFGWPSEKHLLIFCFEPALACFPKLVLLRSDLLCLFWKKGGQARDRACPPYLAECGLPGREAAEPSGSLFLSSAPRDGHCTDSKIASASVSSSTALSSPSEEARLSRSLSTVMFFISSLTNFCMRSPDFTAHEPFSMMAKVRFCRFSAFMSIRKSCMAG